MKIISKIKKLIAAGVVVSIFGLVGLGVVTSQAAQKPDVSSKLRVTAIQGTTQVDGQEVLVEIIVAVPPGEDAGQTARGVLKRAYPDVRELESSEFDTNGLFWGVFSDVDPANDQVIFNYNPDGASIDRLAWSNALNTWSSVVGSNFAFQDGGDTARCPSLVRECKGPQTLDGNNDTGWLNIKEPNVLGVAWRNNASKEVDIVLDNKNWDWYIGDPGSIPDSFFDAETIWLHELGHGLGLAHSAVSGAVMEASFGSGSDSMRRILHQDDIDGVVFLYPDGATPSPSASPTPVPSPTASPVPTPTPEPTPTPIPGTSVLVSNIEYSLSGGKDNDKHIDDIVSIVNDSGDPVEGAVVSVELWLDGSLYGTAAGATGSDGLVTFFAKNAPSGCYETVVTNVTASGLSWDGITPDVEPLCK